MTTPIPWSPPMTSTTIRINGKSAEQLPPEPRSRSLCPSRDRNDLAPFVEPARRTDPVRHIRSRALGAGAELRELEHAVVSPPHFHATGRWFSFRNAHKFASSQFQFVQCRPGGRSRSRLRNCAGFLFRLLLGAGQPAAIGFAQRMLRKGEDNIFANIRSQVHAI